VNLLSLSRIRTERGDVPRRIPSSGSGAVAFAMIAFKQRDFPHENSPPSPCSPVLDDLLPTAWVEPTDAPTTGSRPTTVV